MFIYLLSCLIYTNIDAQSGDQFNHDNKTQSKIKVDEVSQLIIDNEWILLIYVILFFLMLVNIHDGNIINNNKISKNLKVSIPLYTLTPLIAPKCPLRI